MYNITFISTIHKELGQCTAEELFKIIQKIGPEVIFLEAADDTYTEYENFNFKTFGVFHRKLEVAAMQKYCCIADFEYVHVCENGLSDAFHKKLSIVNHNNEIQQLIDKCKTLALKHGFKFLNSLECMKLHEEMRLLESKILNYNELDEIVKADIEAYENLMIRNIYSYSKDNQFNTAIFMCGAAHRKSIIKKIEESNAKEEVNLTWTIYEG